MAIGMARTEIPKKALINIIQPIHYNKIIF